MREVWDWQIGHFEEIKNIFSELAAISGSPFQILENLDVVRRAAIDEWSRKQITASHPEWIEEELAGAEMKDETILIFSNDEIDGLPIQNVASLKDLIAKNDDSLKHFRDGNSIWCFSEIRQLTGPAVCTLSEAKKMDRIKVDLYLEEQYHLLRDISPSLFVDEKGDFKPYSDVKETVFRLSFAMENKDLPCHRLQKYMQQERNLLMAQSESKNGLWSIEKSEQKIQRNSSEDWLMKQAFILKTGEWSDVYVPPNGDIVFFFVKERTMVPAPILEQIQLGKETLAAEAQCLLTDQLIETVLKKQAIVIPLSFEKEKNDDL